ncbi:MAG TPA: hypothetical protein VH760_05335 [Gaiellaceae bacterium]|jgi:hypothetical protein
MFLVVLAMSGCGGGGGGEGTQTAAIGGQEVRGTGFVFRAPEDWTTSVAATSAMARQGPSTLVSVTVLPLVKPYRIALFPRVAKELDRVADTYAANLKGTVTARRTVDVGGRNARQYRVEHGDLVDLLTFVLRAKRSYQLTCRWRSADGEPEACAQLAASFAFR